MEKYLFEMFAVSLLLTLLLELPILWCMGLRQGKSMVLAVLVNILTNPAAVYLHWLGIGQLPIEIGVIAVEAAVYLWFSRDEHWTIPYPIFLALCTNLISWTVGSIIQS